MPPIDNPLAAIAILARHGDDQLRLAARLARGERIDRAELDLLVRAGIVRGGDQPRLPPALIAPVLALEAAVGQAGQSQLGELLRLLRGSTERSQRDMLLSALADELAHQLRELREGGLQAVDPPVLIDDLRHTVQRLGDNDADPAQATTVARLCAQLIEELGRAVAIRRRPRKAKTIPVVAIDDLAQVVADLVVCMPRPLIVPDSTTLARALIGERQPQAAAVRKPPAPGSSIQRRKTVQLALADAHPAMALYSGQPVEEALRRHVCLAGLPQDVLRGSLTSTAEIIPGPDPLAWSTHLAARAVTELADDLETALA